MKRVSIITVNFNQPVATEALMRSISKSGASEQCEIIVVDNASKVNLVTDWQRLHPDMLFIRSESNLGFAGGNNLGLKEAKGEYLFLVNNDTEFSPGLIERLIQTMDEHPRIGLISPKIRYYHQPDTIQYAGFSPMNYYTGRNHCMGEREVDKGQYDHMTGPTGYIHGAAMMIRKDAILKAGLMAENFFLYYEELDWCERVREAGFEIWLEPRALIYHKESLSVGQTSALKEYFMNRNRLLFIRKHGTLSQRFVFYLHFTLLVLPRNILSNIKRKRTELIPYLFKAIWWNLTNSTESQHTGYPLKSI